MVAFGGDVVAADVGWAPAEAIAAQSEAKAESDAEVEEYRGPHVCLICFESVQGQSALNCSECDCQTAPRGTSHVKKDTKYVENCPQCGAIRSVQAFTGANFWTAAPSAMIDLTGEGGGVAAVAALTARGAREEDEAAASAVRARSLCGQRPASDTAQRMWATVRRRGRGPVRLVAAAGQGARGQWSSKGGQEEAAGKEAVEEAGKAGRGTQAVQAAAGQRRGRVERAAGNGHRQTQTREGAAGGASEHDGGSRGICQHSRITSRCKECGGLSICQHNRQRNHCKECGGASICQHLRIRSLCRECGGAGICQHHRIRSRCKECGRASICQHNRIRRHCKECGGASICQHNQSTPPAPPPGSQPLPPLCHCLKEAVWQATSTAPTRPPGSQPLPPLCHCI